MCDLFLYPEPQHEVETRKWVHILSGLVVGRVPFSDETRQFEEM